MIHMTFLPSYLSSKAQYHAPFFPVSLKLSTPNFFFALFIGSVHIPVSAQSHLTGSFLMSDIRMMFTDAGGGYEGIGINRNADLAD